MKKQFADSMEKLINEISSMSSEEFIEFLGQNGIDFEDMLEKTDATSNVVLSINGSYYDYNSHVKNPKLLCA